ncbi:MAG: hypothetical protein KGZ25_00790, partial [Planctomycetes bacterium]|nr:hypothetical protein [Planctomycetota bacterium]
MLPQTKQFVSKTNRGAKECYNAVVSPEGQKIAWFRVEDRREDLMLLSDDADSPAVVTGNAYLLDPCFGGEILCWVEQDGDEWELKSLAASSPDLDPEQPFLTSGRPRGISSATSECGSWFVWEERSGTKTRIQAGRVESGSRTPVEVTDGVFNAYDPDCAIGADGTLYVIFSAFTGGNYRIMLQKMGPDGKLDGGPQLVSNRPGPCLYPSISSRSEGGVWFSYTSFAAGGESSRFVQHLRRRSQHAFFNSCGGQANAGVYEDGALLAPLASRGRGQGMVGAMFVQGADTAGHTRIFESSNGRAYLLLRCHDRARPVKFQEEGTLKRPENMGTTNPPQNHPHICLIRLEDRYWAEPQTLIPRAHLEKPLSFALNDDQLTIAFTEGSRATGWAGAGEYFDDTGQLGVGLATVNLPAESEPEYEFRPFALRPVQIPSVEEPQVDPEGEDFFHAIGQTHAHTNLSVCKRAADRDGHLNYRFIQDVQHGHFGATTDHAYNMWQVEMLHTRKLAEYYYFPGEFVAIPAYEWTGSNNCDHDGGPFGHVNPLWLEEKGDLNFYPPSDPDCAGASLPKLWATCEGKQILTPPHHPADHMHWYDWKFFDERFTPVVEIFQDIRGSGEQPDVPGVTNFRHQPVGHWAVEALRDGKRFGFIASADHAGVA